MNVQAIREKLGAKLSNLSELSTGVLRGVRRHGDSDVSAYFFDVNNQLPQTAGTLNDYLDDVLGNSYFDTTSSPDLRWNNYLYFVVPKDSTGNDEFKQLKHNVEADRSYARKFVVAEDEVDRVLAELDSVALADGAIQPSDTVEKWALKLTPAGLDDVLDKDRPIATIVGNVASGTSRQAVRTKRTTGANESRQLASSHLASLDLKAFRTFPMRKEIEALGKANLLFGTNGVGKTSVLEGIEFLFCGANRRCAATYSTAVAARLTTGGDIRTTGAQPLSDFRTRLRQWYGTGGEDNSRTNRLPNQFARFNFLNTDAAAELSLLKPDPKAGPNNTKILTELLSGFEASQAWQRMQDLRKDIAKKVSDVRSERVVAERDEKAASREISLLEAAPQESDAIFAVLLQDLQRLQWRDLPANKEALSTHLVERLSELTSRLGSLQQLRWLDVPITLQTLRERTAEMTSLARRIQEAVQHSSARGGVRQQRQSQLAAAQTRRLSLTQLDQAAVSELVKLTKDKADSEAEQRRQSRDFARIPTQPEPDGWAEAWGHMPVKGAMQANDVALTAVVEAIGAANRRIEEASQARSQLQNTITQLRHWALKAIEHRHDDLNCPVCGNRFAAGQLIQKVEALAATPADSLVADLRRQIEGDEVRRADMTRTHAWLGELGRFSSVLPDGTASTVQAAVAAAKALSNRQQSLRDAKQAASDGLRRLATVGLTVESVASMCAPLEDDGSEILATPLNVGEAIARLDARLPEMTTAAAKAEEAHEAGVEQLQRLCESAFGQAGQPPQQVLDELHRRMQQAALAVGAFEGLSQATNLPTASDLDAVRTLLEATVLHAQRALAAIQADTNSKSQLAKARELRDRLLSRLNNYKESLARLGAAQAVLDDIIENDSLDAANSAVVAATFQVADRIFSRIHAPSEYCITDDLNAPLKRRESGGAVQLGQVSTGQRAAYALSMFLAMNAQVRAGPKVLLLDDPISHIDDLNALSFLDYLRNLVLKSDQQIFFATADEKIAGLFAHKFAFLKEDFKVVELTRDV
ncbi:hypothetical protein [Roseateles sp. P5_D6]